MPAGRADSHRGLLRQKVVGPPGPDAKPPGELGIDFRAKSQYTMSDSVVYVRFVVSWGSPPVRWGISAPDLTGTCYLAQL